jgi:hypothetical protein
MSTESTSIVPLEPPPILRAPIIWESSALIEEYIISCDPIYEISLDQNIIVFKKIDPNDFYKKEL